MRVCIICPAFRPFPFTKNGFFLSLARLALLRNLAKVSNKILQVRRSYNRLKPPSYRGILFCGASNENACPYDHLSFYPRHAGSLPDCHPSPRPCGHGHHRTHSHAQSHERRTHCHTAAWKQVFDNYAQIFPRQYFSLALFPPLPIFSTTRCVNGNLTGVDHSESQRVSAAIIGLGADNYPNRFVVQENGLTSKDASAGAYGVVKSYAGKVVTGFQLATSAMLSPTYMGNADGVPALHDSLQRGMDANPQFIEVYEPDVLAPAAQGVLASFASALAIQAR